MKRHLRYIVLAAAVSVPLTSLSALAQDAVAAGQQPAASPQTPDADTPAPTAKKQSQSREGFWGHMNPFARKKWVNRQVEPIREREDELDVVTANNARGIHDVDTRSAAGIRRATDAASAADAHAAAAANTAHGAQQTADAASLQANALEGTVNGLDSYTTASTSKIKFAAGATAVGPTGRRELDALASTLKQDRGYILQVEGYSSAKGTAGVAASQKAADSVTRYLVAKHDIPLYRISRIGYGHPTGAHVASGSVVEVTLLHNSLAASNRAETPGSPAVAVQ